MELTQIMDPIPNPSELIGQTTYENRGHASETISFDYKLLNEIEKQDFSINEKTGFEEKSITTRLKERFNLKKRELILVYGVTSKERPISIDVNKPVTNLPLITEREIELLKQRVSQKERHKLGYLYIGSIQIMVKALYQEGRDTPIVLALLDNRIRDRSEAILGIAKGNLMYRKFIFTVYPQFELSLDSEINHVLTLVHDFKRPDFMINGEKPYQITSVVSYAISNTVHANKFKYDTKIDLAELFKPIGHVYQPTMKSFTGLIDIDNIDLLSKPLEGIDTVKTVQPYRVEHGKVYLPSSSSSSSSNQTSKIYSQYLIQGQYLDKGIWKETPFILDTASQINWINCTDDTLAITCPPQQINFCTGQTITTTKMITLLVVFKLVTIPVQFYVLPAESFPVLGHNFLTLVRPYELQENSFKFTWKGIQYQLPRC